MTQLARHWAWLAIAVACDASTAAGQGTTVQLPPVRTFRSSGAVVVPDRGSASLGKVNRARSSRSEWGGPIRPFGNRATSSELNAASARVSVYIHDFAAMEEQLERAASPSVQAQTRSPRRSLPFVANREAANHAGSEIAETPLPSVEAIRAQRRLEAEAREAEARDFFARGQEAEASGKANVARIYYQIAAKRASGTLRDQILAQLDALRRRLASEIAQSAP